MTLKEVQMQHKQLRAQLSKSPWPILKLLLVKRAKLQPAIASREQGIEAFGI